MLTGRAASVTCNHQWYRLPVTDFGLEYWCRNCGIADRITDWTPMMGMNLAAATKKADTMITKANGGTIAGDMGDLIKLGWRKSNGHLPKV